MVAMCFSQCTEHFHLSFARVTTAKQKPFFWIKQVGSLQSLSKEYKEWFGYILLFSSLQTEQAAKDQAGAVFPCNCMEGRGLGSLV